jgi:hypothetical protein
VVGVNPGNPEAEVLSCGFFPQGVAGMLAGLIATQTLIPNRRVAVATGPHALGCFMACSSTVNCCAGAKFVGEEGEAESRGVQVMSDEAEAGTACYTPMGLAAHSPPSGQTILGCISQGAGLKYSVKALTQYLYKRHPTLIFPLQIHSRGG